MKIVFERKKESKEVKEVMLENIFLTCEFVLYRQSVLVRGFGFMTLEDKENYQATD